MVKITGCGLCGPQGTVQREKPGTSCLSPAQDGGPWAANLQEAGLGPSSGSLPHRCLSHGQLPSRPPSTRVFPPELARGPP